MKVILSGAAGILGQAVRTLFLQQGAMVACIGRDRDGLDSDGARWFKCADLADEAAAGAAVKHAVDWMGQLDAIVHVAGAFDWKHVEDSSVADWRALYRANVETTLIMTQACLLHLRKGGAIVAVGAASAQPAGAGMGAYGASKSGVARLVEALAQEVAPRGIRVNAVLPSIIDTPRNRADMPDADTSSWVSPAAIADVIGFLVQPTARAISGALIPVTNNG